MSGRLVVNADDLGVSRGATLGILEAHRNGIVTSASLAVTTPFYSHALDACVRTCPGLGIGLHFTLTSGKPVSPPERVPLLTESGGFFRWRFTSLLRAMTGGARSALAAQVELELEEQLARLAADGIRPDHINGERHVHLIPGIFEIVVRAARRHRIPFVRAGSDMGRGLLKPSHLPGLVLRGGFAKSWLLSRLTARARAQLGAGVRSPDRVASYLYSGRLDLIAQGLLTNPPESGVTEVMVHPGIPEESLGIDLGNRELERYLVSDDRRLELDAIRSPRSESSDLQLTNFSELAAESATAS